MNNQQTTKEVGHNLGAGPRKLSGSSEDNTLVC